MNIPTLPDLTNPALAARLQHKLDHKTKPLASLGRLEALALQLGLILDTDTPQLTAPQLLVCAGDHGLAARGVSAYPSDVTWQMVQNFLSGGAAVSVLARQHGLALSVVDCGVRHDFAAQPGLLLHKVAPGTADSSAGLAMTAAQCHQAIANGVEIVNNLPGNAVLLGEMGIGNTSAASLILSGLADLPISTCTGAGTGLDAAGVARKVQVLQQVRQQHATVFANAPRQPLALLAAVGGFEIATLVGAILQAAAQRRVVVVDGFITTAAVLVAHALQPLVLQRCVFAHQSGEPGHALMLAHLSQNQAQALRPLLDLGLRLGEGSGAALAWPLLQSACAILAQMASFESAGVAAAL